MVENDVNAKHEIDLRFHWNIRTRNPQGWLVDDRSRKDNKVSYELRKTSISRRDRRVMRSPVHGRPVARRLSRRDDPVSPRSVARHSVHVVAPRDDDQGWRARPDHAGNGR